MQTSKIKFEASKIQEENQSSVDIHLEYETTYIIGDKTRDITATDQIIDLGAKEQVAEFVFEDDTVWICDNTNLHDLYPEVVASERSIDGSFNLPTSIRTVSDDRGIGSVALKLIRTFKKTSSEGVGKLAKEFENNQFGDKLEGLYKINASFALEEVNFITDIDHNRPVLLFIHGTASSLVGAYADLAKTSVWQFIQNEYQGNIIGYQHRTLTNSPLKNVVDLLEALPNDLELHIISHSRGGLVGDIITKYSRDNAPAQRGFSEDVHIPLLALEGRTEDIKNIRTLNAISNTKNILVSKFIRVASPSAGTALASVKLENMFNILLNVLLFTNITVGKLSIKALITEIIKTKDSLDALPGIESMNPTSAFLKILNDKSTEAAIDNNALAVISGNSSLGFSLKGLIAIATRLFFWKKNDMVVNTDSMYLGVTRKHNIQYYFDQGTNVTHVTYFSKEETLKALLSALKTPSGESIPGFKSVMQFEVPASDRAILEGGHLKSNMPRGNKPIVVMLPGIMGSNIGEGNSTTWINYWQFLKGGLKNMQNLKKMSAQSLVKTSYEKLYKRLSNTYDVYVHPFDWRQQLNESAAIFEVLIKELLKLNQPIKLVAHSMGGVLIRDFIIKHPETWKQLNGSKNFRVLFLGSPLGGSFRIPAVLFGKDSIINTLSTIDLKHTKKQLLEMFADFPGILSLLPLTTEKGKDFAQRETWEEMRKAHNDSSWPIPSNDALNTFAMYRNYILQNQNSIDYTNMVYIAGKDKATPCDYYNLNDAKRKELVILYTGEGDQSVTWDSGIPQKMTENDTVYYVPSTHGGLSCDPSLFAGIEEILLNGSTKLFSKTRPILRGEAKTFRAEVPFHFDFTEDGITKTILGIEDEQPMEIGNMVLSVSVSNGDLRYCQHPIIAGHFANDGILMAEKAIDYLLQNKLSAKHKIGNYPDNIGTNEICLTNEDDNFKGAIILGLGEPDELTGHLLSKSVEAGIANYLIEAHHRNIPPDYDKGFGISALVIGSGYGGLSIENSIKAIIEGVNKANENVKNIWGEQKSIKPITHIEFMELYEDKALAIMYALGKIKNSENQFFNIELSSNAINRIIGIQKRMPESREESWWNRINVKMKEHTITTDTNKKTYKNLTFGSSNKDAKEEINELQTSTNLIDLFIKEMSKNNKWDRKSAATVFELMIPNDIKDKVRQKGNFLWTLDKESAGYPWELLQDNTKEADPLCVSGGMIRRLATDTYRPKSNVKRAAQNSVLIIGDPITNGFASQLKGAAQEAESVANTFAQSSFSINLAIQKKADEIVKNLFCDDYKVIHIAAHGIITPNNLKESGVVIGDNLYLTTADFNQMGAIPELVFINCCHLGITNNEQEIEMQDRYKLAASIGTQLIEMGVKAIIAAGWAVQDDAAKLFAQEFYSEMLNGSQFGDAVKQARKKVYNNYKNDNNTWGAYQCYGDPFYTLLDRKNNTGNNKKSYLLAEQAKIELDNLRSKMNAGYIRENIVAQIESIEEAIENAKFDDAIIFEKLAFIHNELGNYKIAIEKFEILFKHNDAQYSVSAIEKYCNVSIKYYVEQFFNNINTASETATQIDTIINILSNLFLLGASAERYALLASAYKRKAVVTSNDEQVIALKLSVIYYHLAAKQSDYTDVYCLTNLYLAEQLLRNNDSIYSKENKLIIDIDNVLLLPNVSANAELLNEVIRLSKSVDKIEKLNNMISNIDSNKIRKNVWANMKHTNLIFCKAIIENDTTDESWTTIANDLKKLFVNFSEARKKTEMEQLIINTKLLPKEHSLIVKLNELIDKISS